MAFSREDIVAHLRTLGATNEEIASYTNERGIGVETRQPVRLMDPQELALKQRYLQGIENQIAEFERQEFSIHRDTVPEGVAPLGQFGEKGRVSARIQPGKEWADNRTIYGVQGPKKMYETSPVAGKQYEQLKVQREALVGELQGHEKAINERMLAAKGVGPKQTVQEDFTKTREGVLTKGLLEIEKVKATPKEAKESRLDKAQGSLLEERYKNISKILMLYDRTKQVVKGEKGTAPKYYMENPDPKNPGLIEINPSEIIALQREKAQISAKLGGEGEPKTLLGYKGEQKGEAPSGELSKTKQAEAPKGELKPITMEIAKSILSEAKGDKALAREMAAQRGYDISAITPSKTPTKGPSQKEQNLTIEEMVKVLVKHGIDTKKAARVVEQMSKQNKAGISVDVNSFKRALTEAGIFLKWTDAELMNLYKTMWGGLGKVGKSLLNIKIPGTSTFRE